MCQNTGSYLLTLALGLCGLWVPDASAQQPAPHAQESLGSETAASAVASTVQSNTPQQVPMLLELTENVTSEKVDLEAFRKLPPFLRVEQ